MTFNMAEDDQVEELRYRLIRNAPAFWLGQLVGACHGPNFLDTAGFSSLFRSCEVALFSSPKRGRRCFPTIHPFPLNNHVLKATTTVISQDFMFHFGQRNGVISINQCLGT
jgi:uracil-DNA glycosylase